MTDVVVSENNSMIQITENLGSITAPDSSNNITVTGGDSVTVTNSVAVNTIAITQTQTVTASDPSVSVATIAFTDLSGYVPNTGALVDVNLGAWGLTASSATLSKTQTVTISAPRFTSAVAPVWGTRPLRSTIGLEGALSISPRYLG